MDCVTVATLLTQLDHDQPLDPAAMTELAAAGLVAEAPSVGGGSAEGLRSELRELQDKRAGLRILAASANPAELHQLERDVAGVEARIREVRSAVLAASAGPRRWTLTFRGRDLLGEITSRQDRLAGVPLETFRAEMERLRAVIAATTAKAAKILGIISPASLDIDEVHCRAAAIGLALDSRPAEDLAARWLTAVGALAAIDPTDRGTVAEHLVVSDRGAPEYFVDLVRTLRPDCRDAADAVDCATLAWALPQDQRDERRKLALQTGPRDVDLASAWLVAGTDLGAFQGLIPALVAAGANASEARVAAAFVHLSGVPADVAIVRYAEVLAWLSALSDQGVTVLAGMLGLVNAEPAGTLDDLRLVCAEISRARLAVDGAENLGLGVKLLLGLAKGGGWLLVGTGTATAPTAALSPLIAVSAIAAPAVATFHRSSVMRPMHHRVAHGHAVYG